VNAALRSLLTLAMIGACVGRAAFAQDPPPPTTPGAPVATEERLNRIERKLDEILLRLGAQPQPTGQRADGPVGPAAANSAPPAAASRAPDVAAYKPGAIALVRQAPSYPRDLQIIPTDSVGSFVYAGGAIAMNDLRGKGVRFTGLAAIELQGWLKVAAPGRTQIAVEYRANGVNALGTSDCIANAWLEGRSIGSQTDEIALPATTEKILDLNLGADLQPGLYRVRLWAACTPARDLRLSAELLIKSPSDMNLRPVADSELLHQSE
jgi:hypothetical protein